MSVSSDLVLVEWGIEPGDIMLVCLFLFTLLINVLHIAFETTFPGGLLIDEFCPVHCKISMRVCCWLQQAGASWQLEGGWTLHWCKGDHCVACGRATIFQLVNPAVTSKKPACFKSVSTVTHRCLIFIHAICDVFWYTTTAPVCVSKASAYILLSANYFLSSS